MDKFVTQLGNLHESVLIFGGPYSNLAATKAVYEKAHALGINNEHVICTGDVVAYCAEPESTAQLLIDWGIPVVMGNCEESLGQEAPDCGCGFEEGSACAALSVDWYNYSLPRVSANCKEWMRNLPSALEFKLNGKNFRVVHGSVSTINKFVFYSSPSEEFRKEIELSAAEIIIAGHSGLPFGKKIDNKYWLNAGVIGMPANDGTPDGWYMLLSPNENSVQVSWHRLVYDFSCTEQSMRKNGLAGGYSNAIVNGLWPSMDVLPVHEKSQQGVKIKLDPITL